MVASEEKKAEIFRQYSGKVFGFLYNKIGNRSNAEDLCSEVMWKVVQKLDDFDDTKASLSTWVYTIARNTLIDYYRTRRVHEELNEAIVAEPVGVGDGVLDELADALEKLDERRRDIIVLRYYSGYTLTEIARRMNISYSYVKMLHSSALSDLRKYFTAD